MRVSSRFPSGLLALALTIGLFGPGLKAAPQGPTARVFGLSVVDIYDRGVMVTAVDLGSVARKLGIQRGDVILAVNGAPVLSTDDFQQFLRQVAGGPIVFTVSRRGHVNIITIDAYQP